MRWTQKAVLLLAVGIVAISILNIYPLAAPLIAHHQTKGIGIVLINDLLTSHPQTGFGQYYTPIMLSLAVLAWVIMMVDLKTRRRTTHGTARHAGRRDARKYRAPRVAPHVPLPGRGRRGLQQFTGAARERQQFFLLLGKYLGRDVALSEQQQYQHVLLTAPTGAGKSARFFIPSLLRERGMRSLFIADLKNELYKIAAGWLSQSMQIWLFAPTQPALSAGYNPLAHIHSVEDAQDFAETWVLNTGTSSKEAFWDTNSKLLISAMTLHLVITEKNPALSRLADMLTTCGYEEIRDTLRGSRSREARHIAAQFLESMEKNERLVGSQMTDIGNRFQLLASPNARAVTATNDIDFEEMIHTPTAFFLSISRKDTRRYRPLMACLTQQMFAAWEKRGTNGIACYLDEFTNVGYIPGYAEFISTARALKVSLLMAIQNFSQLDERYGKNDAATIKANAVTHLLLPGAGLEECRYYSERIGDTTVATETINYRNGETTSSQGEARRRLMTADELRTMPVDTMLMLEATAAPLLLKTKLYFQEKKLADRANIPYQVTRVRMEPTTPAPAAAPQSSRGLPPGPQAAPVPIIVDADQEDDDASFFQQE